MWGFSLPDVRDKINQNDDADLKNIEIKSFQVKTFGDFISYCDLERKSQSFVFSSSLEVQEIINSLQNIDVVKTTASEKKKSFLDVNFGLKNSFFDAHQFKDSCKETKISDVHFYFFGALFNISSTKMIRSEIASGIDYCIFEDC